MNNVIKGMFLMLVIIYILSPIDAMPGPVDDIIVFVVALAAAKNKQNQEE